MSRARLATLLVVAGAIALGLALTAGGVATWDTYAHYERSRWLVHTLGLPSTRTANGLDETMKWYGPLWALFLGLLSETALRFVHDSDWVQHAFNFALFPVGLYAVARLLRRAGTRPSTAALAVALLLGAIRLGGHALLNVNDFPMAMLSLLAMLYLWVRLREVDAAARAAGRLPRATLAELGIVATVPFLVRPPVALQLCTLLGFLALYAATALRDARPARRLEALAWPLAAGVLVAVALWPTLWERGRALPLGRGLLEFTHFHWVGAVRFFGRDALSNALPRSYAFIWLPVMLTPATFVLVLCGLGRAALRPGAGSAAAQAFPLPGPRGGAIDVSLRRWLAVHVALLWLGVLVLHPTLYDEERHLLFLYPPLLVLAALGLDDLGDRVKYALAALVAAGALVSYAQWGRYAYVYKSPLIGARNRGAHQFMGDYWGACVPLAVDALAGRVPAGADVAVPGPLDPALVQYARRRQGPHAWPGFGPYRIMLAPIRWPAYLILSNRNGRTDPGLAAVADGRLRELWRAEMPPGEPACVLVEYDGLGGRPPAR